jgi:HK97 family phage major capsid protein
LSVHLIEERARLFAELRTIQSKVESEERDYTLAEAKAFDTAAKRIDTLDLQIDRSNRSNALQPNPALAVGADRAPVGLGGEQAGEVRLGGIVGQESRALVGASGSGSYFVPEIYSPRFFDALTAASVALRSGVTVLEMSSDTLHVPVVSSDPSAAWIDEAGTITPGDPTYTEKVLTAQKLAAAVVASTEALSDSNPALQNMVAAQLVRSLGLALDLAVFEGTGHTSHQPAGLLGTSSVETVDMGSSAGAAFTDLDPIADAINKLAANDAKATAIVMAARDFGALLKLKTATDYNTPLIQDAVQGGGVPRILGVPVYVSSQLDVAQTHGSASNASTAYVLQADQVIVGRRKDVSILVDPYSKSLTDQVVLRATSRWDVAVAHPGAVCLIEGIIPAS